jgi:hypothetical protein
MRRTSRIRPSQGELNGRTQTLNAKNSDWTREDGISIGSTRETEAVAILLILCNAKECGTAAIFEEDHQEILYHNMFTLGCPKCHRYLETTTDLWCANGIIVIPP